MVVEAKIVQAADGNLDAMGKLPRCHPVLKGETLPGANPIDGLGAQIGIVLDEALVEIAGLNLMFRQELFGLRRFFDAFEQITKTRADLRGQDVGQPLAGLFLIEAGGGFRFICMFMQLFDDRAKQRFLAGIMVIERLSREPGFVRDLAHRRAAKAKSREDIPRSRQNPIRRAHATNLTNFVSLSNGGLGPSEDLSARSATRLIQWCWRYNDLADRAADMATGFKGFSTPPRQAQWLPSKLRLSVPEWVAWRRPPRCGRPALRSRFSSRRISSAGSAPESRCCRIR